MSFDLRIKFTGLCLLVRDLAAGRAPLRALLLSHDHAGADAHLPRLVYDKAYANAGATQLSYDLACHPLEDALLRFSASEGTLDTRLPDAIVSLDRHLGTGRLDRGYFQSKKEGVSAKVVLDAGCVTDCMAPDAHDVEGSQEPVWLTSWVEWTIRGLPDTALSSWGLAPLAAGENARPTNPLPPLRPIGEAIHLTIYNVPVHELPPEDDTPRPAKDREQPQHFSAYYHHVQGPHKTLTLNLSRRSVRSSCKPEGPSPRGLAPDQQTGLRQKCYLAQVTAQ